MIHALFALIPALTFGQAEPLTAQPPIIVPGGAGKFDFMNVDPKDRLAFACQPGKTAFVVINLDSGKVTSVPCGAAINGIDADPVGQKVYGAGPGKVLVEFDMRTWKQAGALSLSGPGDSVIFDTKRGTVYVDNDDGTNLWCVTPGAMKITKTVTIKEAPEVMVLDDTRGKIFQNIKTTNSVQVIDLKSKTVVAEYPLGELTSPHGLAEDRTLGRLFSVGKNGKLVILNADTGKIIQTIDVTKSSDQIAYDSQLKRLYIPGSGIIQTVAISASGAKVIGSAKVPKGCHSVTVDPKTHNVWVAYSDDSESYVMKFESR